METRGGWPEVWRANLVLRCATRVLVRVAEFRAMHLAQLDKRAHKIAWDQILRPDQPVRVEATCRKSRIYHAGAAAQRIERAITDVLGAPLTEDAGHRGEAADRRRSGGGQPRFLGRELAQARAYEAAAKAPMRETMAAGFLHECGYRGNEPVFDPMCGSGTFVIEAAEIASGLYPGCSRHFAFEEFASFKLDIWARMKADMPVHVPEFRFFGADRDAGAVRMSIANAARAGVAEWCDLRRARLPTRCHPKGRRGR